MSADDSGLAARLDPFRPADGAVTVFSADWCPYCTRLKGDLVAESIEFREVMIEQDAAAEQVAAEINGGDWIIPTVVYADGAAQVNPSIDQVRATLAGLAAG